MRQPLPRRDAGRRSCSCCCGVACGCRDGDFGHECEAGRSGLRLLASWSFMALLLCAFSPGLWAASRTYEIKIRAFCDPGEPKVCGHASEQALADYYRGQLRLLNEMWAFNDISFRIPEVVVVYETSYSAITGEGIDDPMSPQGGLIHDLRKDIAAVDPQALYLFLLGSGGPGKLTFCWSSVAPFAGAYPEGIYGLFCPGFGDFSVLGHELGHHFCLPHPFSYEDPADDSPVDHDGDKIADTPPDPGLLEKETATNTAGFDQALSGAYVDGHEWCTFTQKFNVDPGSPIGRYCEPHCWLRDGGVTQVSTATPNTALAVSYYKGACSGPYVVDGNRTEAFSPGSRDRIDLCIATVPARQGYLNVCADRGGDSDGDGICDLDDLCPSTFSVSPPADSDGDGVADACDNCPTTPNPTQVDTDLDSAGDACDPDDDQDGCLDLVDQNPLDAQVVTGKTILCFGPELPIYTFEGNDSDGDGILDCSDPDDDNDGFSDAGDPCPTIQGTDPALCATGVKCPPVIPISRCSLDCELDFTLHLVSLVNPVSPVVFEKFALLNDSIVLSAQPSRTLSETATLFGGSGLLAAGGESQEMLALELWSRDPVRKVETLIEFDPHDVILGQSAFGRALEFRAIDFGVLEIEATWGFPLKAVDLGVDSDGDGVPDAADNCLEVANRHQRDSDGDGFGDPCDPDFDQDGVVEEEEILLVQGCEGVDPDLQVNLGEPEHDWMALDVPETDEVARSWECRRSDLDEDAEIDGEDTFLAFRLAGRAPGPSGFRTPSDEDRDGVPNAEDLCPGTSIPEGVPTRSLGVNRFALVDHDSTFDTVRPPGGGSGDSFDTVDTGGCSCEQIISVLGLGQGHQRFGCSLGAMRTWVSQAGERATAPRRGHQPSTSSRPRP